MQVQEEQHQPVGSDRGEAGVGRNEQSSLAPAGDELELAGDYRRLLTAALRGVLAASCVVARDDLHDLISGEVQQLLMERGHHRSVKLPDLLVGAVAEIEGFTVMHYDSDFDRISEVTGQPSQWVVEAGTVS